jgi:hypothetical protein
MLAITTFDADGSTTWTLGQNVNTQPGAYQVIFNVKAIGDFIDCLLDIIAGEVTRYYFSTNTSTAFNAYEYTLYTLEGGSLPFALTLGRCTNDPTF